MKSIIKVSVLLTIVTFLGGCMTTISTNYKASLNSIEKPTEVEKRYGESKITKVSEKGKEKYQFEDKLIKATFFSTKENILTNIENKSDYTIKIVWNQAAYIGPEGSTCGLVHGEVKGMNIGEKIPPTIIPRNANVSKLIIPECKIKWTGSYWNLESLISDFPSDKTVPNNQAQDEYEVLLAEARKYKGKEFRILLPFEIEGTINEYTFKFELDEIVVEKPDGEESSGDSS